MFGKAILQVPNIARWVARSLTSTVNKVCVLFDYLPHSSTFTASNGIFYTRQSVLQFLCQALNCAMKTNRYTVAQLSPDIQLKENERRFLKNDIRGPVALLFLLLIAFDLIPLRRQDYFQSSQQ